jgi:hypothetical protein
MDNKDIRSQILLNIDNDIKNLLNTCSIDKLSRTICSNLSYWKPKFEEFNLPINRICNNPLAWIAQFEKERKLKFYTDRLIEILENPKDEDFQSIDVNDVWDPIGLIVYTYDVPFMEIFNIPEINQDDLSLMVDTYILDKFRKKGLEEHTFARMIILDDVYMIEIVAVPTLDEITVTVTRDTMKQILYKILSFGFIPLDDINNEKINIIKKK